MHCSISLYQRPLYQKQWKTIDVWHFMDNLYQNRKIPKITKKRSFRKRFSSSFYWIITQNTLLIIINIHNSIKWHRLDTNATFQKLKYAFTLDAFLTVIKFIHKNLFYHQPFDGLSIIINTIKLFAKKKKEYKFGWHSNKEDIKIKI